MNKTFTNYSGGAVSFDVVIDDLFSNLKFSSTFDTAGKALLSLVNSFEDGDWKATLFHTFIWNHIKETALTHAERQSLVGEEGSILENSARKLRLVDSDNDNEGGEIGEILLYGLMKKYYNALPIVPKIFYKQNTNDYAKGADSVHIVLDDQNDFSLWLGESKFYSSLDDGRLDKIVASVLELLKSDKLRKEFSIVTSLKEIDGYVSNPELTERIKASMKEGISLDEVKKRLHVPILLLHECEITSKQSKMSQAYKDELMIRHLDIAERYINKQNTLLKAEIWCYDDISFHLILFPVPEKDPIVKSFFNRANILKS